MSPTAFNQAPCLTTFMTLITAGKERFFQIILLYFFLEEQVTKFSISLRVVMNAVKMHRALRF